ncbi:protocadherin beta-6-like isoform X2 [Anguilla rostrata]|uniref:protocadherin beta-6-like isoform X2 n=1 Tax=Anguilla rostrata TaxID=7938 RepID=UPI0030D0B48E
MEIECRKLRWNSGRTYLHFAILLLLWNTTSAQIRYSIQEELKIGTAVGNIAKDLGIDRGTLSDRNLRIVTGAKQDLFQVNGRDGALFVNQRIDREELCGKSIPCHVNLKAVIENPLEMHHVTVEIVDVNDHSPSFPDREYRLEVPESTMTGARFQIEGAHDPDTGVNELRLYKLSQNEYFRLEVENLSTESKIPFLILQKPLDREITSRFMMVLTAIDGGSPPKSGSLNVSIIVLDANDNGPVCGQQKYTVSIKENVSLGTSLLSVEAVDLDEGANGEVEYSFRSKLRSKISELFELNNNTGEIKVKGPIDFEENDLYDLNVQVTDKGPLPLTTHCNVFVKVEDVNDNKPEIDVTSLSSKIREDAPAGTVVALMGVTDLDSGVNGQVVCTLAEDLPFDLKPSSEGNFYSLVTKSPLDRESVSQYDITVTAKDLGNPPLSTIKTIRVEISDINDHRPVFSKSPYSLYLVENNAPGASMFSVSASDADEGENAQVSYSLGHVSAGHSVASFVNINSENGNIYALKSFDFETLKTFQFHVVAKDSGTPSLSSNVTVHVFILDQNDNAPVILSPVSANGSAEGVEEIPRNVNAGHSVAKVRAFDADIGYNAWLSFSLQHATDASLFGLERYTGQIRTLRSFTETDEAEHKLVIVVKDNGNVSLSATATVIIKAVEPKEAFAASDTKSAVQTEEENNVTFYLIITLSSVSALFLLSIIGLIAMQCSKPPDYSPKYSRDPNYADTSGNGTLCHSIQYRSGDKRYMLVGPRMSIGSAIVPGSNANTLMVPDHRSRTSGEFHVAATDSGTPSLSSNVTVNVFILDRNDNAPVILSPVNANGSAEGVEEIPRNVIAGHSVAKVRAYDADIGYNAWLSFSLQHATDASLFGLERYTGQIRTLRSFTETDEAEHKLVIVVKDNGNVSLSATATVIIKAVEPKEAFAASDTESAVQTEEENNVTFYLIITLSSVSALFLLSIIGLIVMQCSKPPDYSPKYSRDPNYADTSGNGTLCHSIQYRSGDKRYMLVGPRMSIGSAIVPGSNANTLVVPDHRRGTSGEPKAPNADWRYSASLRAGMQRSALPSPSGSCSTLGAHGGVISDAGSSGCSGAELAHRVQRSWRC